VSTLTARLLLAAGGLTALACLGVGVTKTFYFERTPTAVSNERIGHILILVGCTALLAVALAVRNTAPTWVSVTVALPAVLVGGLTLLAGWTLLPQLVALPAMGLALAGLVGLVVGHR
jgi:hypothetical protein